jgi:hypothetical protein
MKNCDFCNVKDKKDLEDLIKYQDFDVNKKLDNLKKLQEVVFCDSINNRMDDFCNSINNRMDELYKIKKEIDSFFIKIGNKISYCGQCYYDIKYKNRHHTIDKGQILDCWYFTNKGKELLQKIYKNVGYFDIPSDGECWCCNVNITIEKCHIIPKSLGGSSTDPLNFVLLCNECHKKSPNTIDYLSFFKWLIFEIPIMRKKRIEW